MLGLPRGACPEHNEILRYAQNDRERRARNDRGLFSRVGTYRLLVGKVFHSKAEVAQNSCQGAFRNVTSALGNGSEAFVHGVPPDFMGAGTLSDKLAVQLAEFPGQHAVGHTGTRSSA